VRAGVVENQVHVEHRGHARVDRIEELTELTSALSAVELTDHLAARRIQGGKERGCSVPRVVMGAPLDLPRPASQDRWAPIVRPPPASLELQDGERIISEPLHPMAKGRRSHEELGSEGALVPVSEAVVAEDAQSAPAGPGGVLEQAGAPRRT
jgi:hypothetical protein